MEAGKKFKDLVYEHQDYEALQKQMDKLTEEVVQAKSYEDVRKIIFESEKVLKPATTHSYIAYIRSFLDKTDEYYQQEMGYSMQGLASLQMDKFARALVESPFAEEIDREFGPKYLDNTRDTIRLNSQGTELRMKEEELIARYQGLKAGLVFHWKDEEVSEGQLYPYFESPDREERRAVRIAHYEGYLKHRDEFISLLKELVALRVELAKQNGFENYLDYANLKHGRRNYGEKELRAFREQVKQEVVPFAAIYQKAQAKRLGLEKLKLYDYSIVFPDGNPKPAGDEEFLTEAARTMYKGLSEEAGKYFDRMVEKELFDIKSSPNKIAGMGFCVDLPEIDEVFVFANCHGTSDDVAVYTHEIGHALQGYLSMEEQPLADYLSAMTDVAEIPSKTMELFSYPYAEAFFGEDAEKFRFAHLQGAISEIMAYCSTDEFESYLYTHTEESVEEWALELDRVMKEYDSELDNEEFEEYWKQGINLFRNMGIYMFPKYLISYALSEMGALALNQRMEEEPERAWKDYSALLRAGGSKGYRELLATAGLQPAYEEGMVRKATAHAREAILAYLKKEGTL